MLIPRRQILRWTVRGAARDASTEDNKAARSEFPKLRMPRNGRRIFFWKTASSHAAEPDRSEILETIEINLHRWRLECEHLCDLVHHSSDKATLEEGYAALARLLRALEAQHVELIAVQNALAARPTCKLAGWLITEREILSAEAAALKADLDALYQAVRRAHVEVAGALLELR